MANIFDYLFWRCDIPLSADPFNEVDALVLAELTYTKFSGLEGEKTITLPKERNLFFSSHSREDILSLTAATAKAPLLMDYMYDGNRFKNTEISHYVSKIDLEKEAQFSAATYILDDGTIYVAFRGTDGTVVGWKEDFNLSYLPETEGQRLSVEYLNQVGSIYNCPIIVGGHSKGGNFATYAASFCDSSVQDKIVSVYSFDGPGFKPERVSLDGYRRILPKIIRIVPDTSIIGQLLTHSDKLVVVKSNASGISQHDAFSWEINRNRFLYTELSELGMMISETIGNWLDRLEDDDRRMLTDTIFGVIESTGSDTFRKMADEKLKTAESVFNSMRSLPKESRQQVTQLIGKLIQTGGQTAAMHLPGLHTEK